MEGYNWKGNVRQLSNFVERVGVLLTNGVAVEDILSTLPRLKPKETEPKETDVTLERWSREAIIKALSVNQLNVSRTARLLKCSRSTLYKKMEEFNIRITNMK
nr:helix-turn-helix domain-containing protein [Megasphaera hominis]